MDDCRHNPFTISRYQLFNYRNRFCSSDRIELLLEYDLVSLRGSLILFVWRFIYVATIRSAVISFLDWVLGLHFKLPLPWLKKTMRDEGEQFNFDQWINEIVLNTRDSFISPHTLTNTQESTIWSVLGASSATTDNVVSRYDEYSAFVNTKDDETGWSVSAILCGNGCSGSTAGLNFGSGSVDNSLEFLAVSVGILEFN